jgi:hypothetical protein
MRSWMKIVVVLCSLVFVAPALARPHPLHWIGTHKLLIASDTLLAASSALDVASTRAAMSRGNSEANPLYGARPGLGHLIGVKLAIDLPFAVGNSFLDRYTRSGSPWKRSQMLLPSLILAAPQIWAAQHNWSLDPAK